MLFAFTQRTRIILLGVIGAIAAFFLFGGASGSGATGDPFDAVPQDSFLVATVDLAELRRSPLYEVLLGKESKTDGMLNAGALGIRRFADACGFDPLARVEKLAVGVPEEGDKGELGVAARVTVTRDELAKCSENLAGQRGGKIDAKDVGSFVVIEESTGAQETARPRLAYGRGGLLVAGRGAWFDAMLAAADGKKPGARNAPGHVAIRSSLTRHDGWHSPTILVSALLPRSLRDRLKNEMGAEVSTAAGQQQEKPQDVMAGVLGVAGVGAALRAGGSGQSIDVALELSCDAEDACAAVEKLILKKRLDWSKELMLRMVGLGRLLDSIEVKREGTKIRVTAGDSANALASTLDRVLRLSAGGRAPSRDHSGGEPSTPALKMKPPGETIPAPRPSAPVP